MIFCIKFYRYNNYYNKYIFSIKINNVQRPKLYIYIIFLLIIPNWACACAESFISIKFENNGVGSWDKGKVSSKVSIEQCNNLPLNKSLTKEYSSGPNTVVEHVKARSALRWQKRIGHLFQVIRWKRSNKGSACHVGSKVEGVKVRSNGWIRNLTKRRTKE